MNSLSARTLIALDLTLGIYLECEEAAAWVKVGVLLLPVY